VLARPSSRAVFRRSLTSGHRCCAVYRDRGEGPPRRRRSRVALEKHTVLPQVVRWRRGKSQTILLVEKRTTTASPATISRPPITTTTIDTCPMTSTSPSTAATTDARNSPRAISRPPRRPILVLRKSVKGPPSASHPSGLYPDLRQASNADLSVLNDGPTAALRDALSCRGDGCSSCGVRGRHRVGGRWPVMD
jgi:hypothetical protein